MKEAMFYERESDSRVRCGLCRHRCLIGDGARGICAVRGEPGGNPLFARLRKLVAENVDPSRRSPSSTCCRNQILFHRHGGVQLPLPPLPELHHLPGGPQRPRHRGTTVTGSGGREGPGHGVPLHRLHLHRAHHLLRVRLRHRPPRPSAGLLNVFVTNGYITKEALEAIAPYLDAANIDLKGFTDAFYRDYVNARLSEVLDSIIEYRKQGIWIELTTLIIPGLNDADEELKGIASFIAENLGADTPWHVTQFYPTYKLTDRPGRRWKPCGGRGTLARGGAALCLRGECPRRRRREYLVPILRNAPDRALRLPDRKEPDSGWGVPRLRHRHRRHRHVIPFSFQAEIKRCPFSLCALGPDLPAVEVDDALDRGQSDSDPSNSSSRCSRWNAPNNLFA